ncbi:hypothetical protein J2778_002100 [Paraburkholderia graminis]|uniref:hypothetical protein n=1 Tax=Burkholderiaceae TaxID=119060 RepID=UPI002861D400|nr:hypothetical protein [Paraburkholderia graminis]MDR6474606.1 hypothetical protein [Paraburkholderia graminis]
MTSPALISPELLDKICRFGIETGRVCLAKQGGGKRRRPLLVSCGNHGFDLSVVGQSPGNAGAKVAIAAQNQNSHDSLTRI